MSTEELRQAFNLVTDDWVGEQEIPVSLFVHFLANIEPQNDCWWDACELLREFGYRNRFDESKEVEA
jgi:hypothetical protein